MTTNGTVYSNVLFTGKGFAKINISVKDIAGIDYTLLDVRKRHFCFIIVKLKIKKKKHSMSSFALKPN